MTFPEGTMGGVGHIRVAVLNQVQFCLLGTFGNVYRHFWLSYWGGITDIQWVEAGMLLTRTKLPSITKSYPTQNVNSARNAGLQNPGIEDKQNQTGWKSSWENARELRHLAVTEANQVGCHDETSPDRFWDGNGKPHRLLKLNPHN